MLRFFPQTSSPKGASPRRARFSRRYVVALLLDLLALAADQLAVRSTAFANAYAHHIYRLLSLGIGSVMGLVPFSVVELLLYGLVLFLVFDFLRALYRSVREGMQSVLRFSSSSGMCFFWVPHSSCSTSSSVA